MLVVDQDQFFQKCPGARDIVEERTFPLNLGSWAQNFPMFFQTKKEAGNHGFWQLRISLMENYKRPEPEQPTPPPTTPSHPRYIPRAELHELTPTFQIVNPEGCSSSSPATPTLPAALPPWSRPPTSSEYHMVQDTQNTIIDVRFSSSALLPATATPTRGDDVQRPRSRSPYRRSYTNVTSPSNVANVAYSHPRDFYLWNKTMKYNSSDKTN